MEPQTIKTLMDLLMLIGLWVALALCYFVLMSVLPRLVSLGRHATWYGVWVSVKYHADPYLQYYKYRNQTPGTPGLRHWTSIQNRKQSFMILPCQHNPEVLAVTIFDNGLLVRECHYLTLQEWDVQRKKHKLYPVSVY